MADASSGRLLYVVGPSGSGKDSLLRHARQRLEAQSDILFAHRYITRPVELQGENHIALSVAEFEARRSANLFAMHWDSHGLRYGIGREINFWLQEGRDIVVNGSREYLPEALCRYPELFLVQITASAETLSTRLLARGRESAEQVARRIERAGQFTPAHEPSAIIENNGTLTEAGDRLVALLCATRKKAWRTCK
ncbi:MAG: phosphonate metabolism protein/1,5-bisphosphokinase (PRPP-forming) PhnN [Nevskiaceae bacterium]|jgi:ribose 1,5-bisphosphokinase|nr:phosphonate metabolism protein/1,5-bisphosphokinase (PRPP-forming) PhnN [Nevskiaceae bacterium]